jgi:hypothetical protein
MRPTEVKANAQSDIGMLLQHHVEQAPTEDLVEDEFGEHEDEAMQHRPEHVWDKAQRVLAWLDAGSGT